MNKWWVLAGASIALLTVVIPTQGAQMTQGAQPMQAAAPKIGVVRLQTCFDKYQRREDLEKALEKIYEDSKTELKQLQTEFDKIKESLSALEGALKERKLREAKELELKIQFAKKWHGIKRRDNYVESMTKLYDDIRSAVDKIGEKENYDLILKVEEPEIDNESQENVFERIVRNPVLYSTKSVDMTDAVVKYLNEEYAKKREPK